MECLNFGRIRFHTFGCEDCTIKTNFGLSDSAFVTVVV